MADKFYIGLMVVNILSTGSQLQYGIAIQWRGVKISLFLNIYD